MLDQLGLPLPDEVWTEEALRAAMGSFAGWVVDYASQRFDVCDRERDGSLTPTGGSTIMFELRHVESGRVLQIIFAGRGDGFVFRQVAVKAGT